MKTALPLNQLIAKANEELKEHSWYEEGMEIKEAKMVGTILTMHAAGLLDERGVQKPESVVRLNEFAHSFASRYTLI